LPEVRKRALSSLRDCAAIPPPWRRGVEAMQAWALRGVVGRPIIFSEAVPTVEHIRDVLLF